ncbi:MAG: hypothetical protein IKP65_03585 [Alphaproteobacteria bacterium]|nr:hypothetical protein [Alphaproteobacteria bacterium]
MYDWVADANAHYIEKPAWGGTQVWSYTWPICEWHEGDSECKCIDEDNYYSALGLSGLNQ